MSIFSLCSRRERFSLVDLNNVLIFSADDKVNRVGECFREMKLQAQVSLFHKLKMISRAVIWGQSKCQYGATRVIITSIYLTARILVKLSNTREKTLIAGYHILNTSNVKIQKQRFSGNLFSVHIDTHFSKIVVFEVEGVGTVTPIISICLLIPILCTWECDPERCCKG